jgi:methylenetetrahydrofolate--tRNA-(uracil-5-)-methyltransferase
MAGVEGYVESAALGWLAGVNAAFAARGEPPPLAPETTAHGALVRYLVAASPKHFQPMNVNYGLFPAIPDLPSRIRKREKYERYARRALEDLAPYAERTASVVE